VFLNNRYQDPATGIFISVDPLVAKTGTPYLYANGNPVRMADPTGLFGWDSVGLGGVADAVSDVVDFVEDHAVEIVAVVAVSIVVVSSGGSAAALIPLLQMGGYAAAGSAAVNMTSQLISTGEVNLHEVADSAFTGFAAGFVTAVAAPAILGSGAVSRASGGFGRTLVAGTAEGAFGGGASATMTELQDGRNPLSWTTLRNAGFGGLFGLFGSGAGYMSRELVPQSPLVRGPYASSRNARAAHRRVELQARLEPWVAASTGASLETARDVAERRSGSLGVVQYV